MKILSKVKPAYTDVARFYKISGSVLVRVTFLASGEIGSISPTKRLPFGLTEQAVNAAKGIRFTPAYVDGKPITIVRTVDYSFVIY